VLAEDRLDGHRFVAVVERRAGSMRVDVIDLIGTDAGALQRRSHGALVALALLRRRRHVVGIGRRPVSDDLGNQPSPAGKRMLELLENEDGAAAR